MTLPDFLARECARVQAPDPERENAARARLDSLTKPPGSLGRLEDLAARMYAVQGQLPLRARPARMYTIAADHGVVAEGVAASPKEVTALMVRNFLAGGAAVNALCAAADAELRVVDAGLNAPPLGPHPLLVSARIADGTANMAKGPAMSREECERALELGISLARSAADDGVRVLGTGEMGIGNTTASSALFCAWLGFAPEEVTGMGAGVPKAGLAHKSDVIRTALEANIQALRGGNSLDVLAALGGLEIVALAGLIIGGAAQNILCVIDGYIATAAFLAAERLCPGVRPFCVFAHGSAEAGHAAVLEHLGAKPLLDLGMRLGEGTGAALTFFLLHAAAAMFNDMATFDEAGIVI